MYKSCLIKGGGSKAQILYFKLHNAILQAWLAFIELLSFCQSQLCIIGLVSFVNVF